MKKNVNLLVLKDKEKMPEALYRYIKKKFDNFNKEEEFWDNLYYSTGYTTDYVHEHILTLSEDELVKAKSQDLKEKWFNRPAVQVFLNESKILNDEMREKLSEGDFSVNVSEERSPELEVKGSDMDDDWAWDMDR